MPNSKRQQIASAARTPKTIHQKKHNRAGPVAKSQPCNAGLGFPHFFSMRSNPTRARKGYTPGTEVVPNYGSSRIEGNCNSARERTSNPHTMLFFINHNTVQYRTWLRDDSLAFHIGFSIDHSQATMPATGVQIVTKWICRRFNWIKYVANQTYIVMIWYVSNGSESQDRTPFSPCWVPKASPTVGHSDRPAPAPRVAARQDKTRHSPT